MTLIMTELNSAGSATPHSDKPSQYEVKKNRSNSAIWLFSVLIHGIILVVLSLSSPPSEPIQPPSRPALAAHLYRPPVKPAANVRPAAPVAPNLPTAAPQAANTTNITTTTTQLPQPVSTPTPDPQPALQRPPEQMPLSGSALSSAPKQHPLNSKTALRQFITAKNAAALHEVAGQQAATHRQQYRSPDLSTTRLLADIEKRSEPRKVQVRCDSALNSTLVLVSTLAGGTMNCSQRQTNHDEFIERRRNQQVNQ